MRRSYLLAVIAIVVLVGANVWVFWPTTSLPPTDEEFARIRQQFMEQERRAWAESDVVRLDDPSLEEVIASLKSKGCLELPADASAVSWRSLEPRQRKDIVQAIAGLCRAYFADTPEAVVAYRHSRGERLKPDTKQMHRRMLRKLGLPAPDDNADDLAWIRAIWDAELYGIFRSAHWVALRPKACCMQFYRLPRFDHDVASSVGQEELEKWPSMMAVSNRFMAPHPPEDELRATGSLLLSDVKLVIDHDPETLLGITCVYYIRFWWASSDAHWHPLDLRCSPEDFVRNGINPRVVF